MNNIDMTTDNSVHRPHAAEPHIAMNPEITLIKKSGPAPLMSKRISLDEQGVPRSDGSQCLMVQGTATRARAGTASALARHIMACGSDQAIALGAMNAELDDSVPITTDNKLKERPDAISRSRSSSTIGRERPPGR